MEQKLIDCVQLQVASLQAEEGYVRNLKNLIASTTFVVHCLDDERINGKAELPMAKLDDDW
jgi:hypothetical protein